MMRDTLKNTAYFDEAIDFYIKDDAEVREKLSRLHSEAKARRSNDLLEYSYNALILRYSRGDAIEAMRIYAETAYKTLKLRREILSSIKSDLSSGTYTMWEQLAMDTIFQCLSILAFMVALHFPKEEIADALKQIGHEGEDVLLDLAATYTGQGTGIKTSSMPKIYGDLAILISADKDSRPLLLKRCVKNWYSSMREMGWHDSHKGAEDAYDGYWCFDIALVVMLLDIDDRLVQDHPHYPADLVKYYRSTQ